MMDVQSQARAELSPETARLLQSMAKTRRTAFHLLEPELARERYEVSANLLEIPMPALAREEVLYLRSRDGHDLPVRLLVPAATEGVAQNPPVLLYLHGGGCVVGSSKTHLYLCRNLAVLAGCAVLVLDYRLAPQWQFPTALHDAWDALLQVKDRAGSWGLDAERIALGGDSAGANMAAVCAILAKEQGLPLDLQLLFYPSTAPWQNSASFAKYGQGYFLERAQVDWCFQHYMGQTSRDDWRFAPMLYPDFSGLCPLWLGLAECDPLFDECIVYADALRGAGVAVELEVYRGVVHEFIKMPRLIPQAMQARRDAAQALRRVWGLGA